MPPASLKQIKRTLCVKGAGLEVDTFDSQTRERLREFVAGVGWGMVGRNGAPKFDATNQESLSRATQNFPTCGDPLKNAYEVGIFTRNAADADLTMQRAATSLQISPLPTDRRATIVALRKQFDPSSQSDEIDDRLWDFIRTRGPLVNPQVPMPVPSGRKKNP
jgi:hypothetical protein